MAKQLPHVPHV